MFRCTLVVVVGLAYWPNSANGQVVYGGPGYYDAGAATAGESYARGMSGMISAQGQKNLNDSQAAINLTQAQAQHNENKLQSTEIYWQRKEIYAQQQAKKNYALGQKRDRTLQRIAVKPLAKRDFDDKDGAVHWPQQLTAAEYDKYRNPLEEMLEKRAHHGVLDSDDYYNAKLLTKEWRQLVTSERDKYDFDRLKFLTNFIMQVDKTIEQDLG